MCLWSCVKWLAFRGWIGGYGLGLKGSKKGSGTVSKAENILGDNRALTLVEKC